jgi:hypothetical protein
MNPINTNICPRTNLALKLNYISPPLFQAITQLVEIGRPKPSSPVEIGQDWSSSATQKSPPICTNLHQSTPIYTEIAFPPTPGSSPSSFVGSTTIPSSVSGKNPASSAPSPAVWPPPVPQKPLPPRPPPGHRRRPCRLSRHWGLAWLLCRRSERLDA